MDFFVVLFTCVSVDGVKVFSVLLEDNFGGFVNVDFQFDTVVDRLSAEHMFEDC